MKKENKMYFTKIINKKFDLNLALGLKNENTL